MKTFEEGSKKIQQICDLLKKDAIEPAKKEAEALLDEAKIKAQQIIEEAEKQADTIHREMRIKIDQERNVFQSFMAQAAKQTIETLKQAIEQKFFNGELHQLITAQTVDPKVIARITDVIIQSIEKEGIDSDLSVIVPHAVSSKEVNAFLGEHILSKLKEQSVVLGAFSGGVQVKIHGKNMIIDISDKAIAEILGSYRKGFRELFFQN